MKAFFSIIAAVAICLNAAVFGISAKDAANSLVDGHKVYVAKTTDDGKFWKYELLRNANKTIEMATGYAFGECFIEVYSIMKEKLEGNPEIQIHLMVSQNSGLFTKDNENLIIDLAKAYPNNFHYVITDFSGPVIQAKGIYTTENHAKLLIIDEKYFQLGGTNLVDNLSRYNVPENYEPKTLAESFLPKAACDQDIVVSGPMAKKLREEFYTIYELYKTKQSVKNSAGPYIPKSTEYKAIAEEDKTSIDLFESNPDLIQNVKAFGVISGPRYNYHLIGDLYEYYIKEAKGSIEISHMYFFPLEKIYNALIDGAKRNLQINVITNGLNLKNASANSTIALYAYINRVNYIPVMLGKTFRFYQKGDARKSAKKGTSVYEYEREYVLYHKKVLIVDNHISTVGSYNLGLKSENSDFEVNLFMDSTDVALKLHDGMVVDMQNSRLVPFNDALDYHFSFFYNLMKGFESTFFDGIILSVDDLPKESDDLDHFDFNDLQGVDEEYEMFPGFGGKDNMGWDVFENR